MYQSKDDELIGVLTAISVVSKRLASNLSKLAVESKPEEGENYEQNERNTNDNTEPKRMCCCYRRHC